MKIPLALCLSAGGAILGTAQEPNTPAETTPNKVVKVIPSDGTRMKLGGTVAAARIIKKLSPVYPPLARQTRIQGTVRLHVILSKDGSVQQLEVLSGHPLLVQSAMDAVRQWKYQPMLLNGEPVEVDTTIDVIYSLNEDKGPDTPKLMTLVPSIEPHLRADILLMMKTAHMQEMSQEAGKAIFEKLRPQLFTNIKDETLRAKIADSFLAKLLHTFDEEEFSEGVVTAYAKYFNDEEVKELTKFYGTPLGQKFNKVSGNLTADLMELGQTVAKHEMPGIFQQLCEEFPEALGGKLSGCPVGTDKKSELTPENGKSLTAISARR